MRVRQWFIGLVGTVLLIGAARSSSAGFVVDNGDLINGQYRLEYSSWTDKYYENGVELLSGWQQGADEYANMTRYVEQYHQRSFLYPTSGTGSIVWGFDLSATGQVIEGLEVMSSSHIFSGGAKYYVSTDGINWVNYSLNTGGTTYGTYYDLTEYVVGSDKYFIKGEAYGGYNAQLFRESPDGAPALDNRVTLGAVPEPSTFFLLSSVGMMGLAMAWLKGSRQ